MHVQARADFFVHLRVRFLVSFCVCAFLRESAPVFAHTLQYSAVQCSVMQCSEAQCSAAQCSAAQRSAMLALPSPAEDKLK